VILKPFLILVVARTGRIVAGLIEIRSKLGSVPLLVYFQQLLPFSVWFRVHANHESREGLDAA